MRFRSRSLSARRPEPGLVPCGVWARESRKRLDFSGFRYNLLAGDPPEHACLAQTFLLRLLGSRGAHCVPGFIVGDVTEEEI